MTSSSLKHSLRALLLALGLLTWLVPGLACATEDESDIFVGNQPETLLTTSHAPRPSSKIAENVTVITAADIERLNAHTLAEVLQTVPGIQLDFQRTPTTYTFFNIQGALNSSVLVLVDGIRQNQFSQGTDFPGLTPVQNIERIEIIKGAASTAWGSALGGVVNIVTKSPVTDRSASGMVSGSIGSQFTTDSRAELSGSQEHLGYYLTATNIHSDGLTPNTATNLNTIYGKFSHALPGNGSATLGLSYITARPGMDEGDTSRWGFVHDNNENRRSNGFLKISQPLSGSLKLDINGYITYRDDHFKYGGRDDQGAIVFYNNVETRETTRGITNRLFWGDSEQNLTLGIDYGHAVSKTQDLLSTDPPYSDKKWDNWSFYANGAYSFGKLSILPGIRHDLTGLKGDITSYSLGATYQLTDKTTLRTYLARGYSLPNLNYNNPLQKIKTVQGGFETGDIPWIWLKGTYFYNNVQNSEPAGDAVALDQNRQGVEIELRTVPVHGFSLASAYTYLYAEDDITGHRLQTNSDWSVPPHTVKLALKYDNTDIGLRATLTGNYVWWNRDPSLWYGYSDKGMLWDLHLNWKPFPKKELLTPELFFSAHNLFNGNQTVDTSLYNSAPRWFEGGLKVRF